MTDAHESRFKFARCLAQLLQFAADEGIAVQMGECWRSPEQAQWNAQHGKGVVNSLHCERLAVDLLCFRDKGNGEVEFLADGAAPEYKKLGDYWKTLFPQCRWGGDFSHPDYDHFSLAIDARG